MRGPGDEAPVAPGTVLEEGETQPRPLGGGALLRLIQELESDGLSELAAQTVELAVPENDVGAVMKIAAEMGVASASPRRRKSTKSRSTSRRSEAGKGNDGVGAAEEIAEAFLEAADVMGPPTPFGPQWRPCGPWTVINGQTYGATRINVSGRVSALAVDPEIQRTCSQGRRTEGFGRPSTEAPRGPSHRLPTDLRRWAHSPSIRRSPRPCTAAPARATGGRGSAWACSARRMAERRGRLCTAPFVGDGFHSLVVDPSNRMRIFAGTRGGLWVSTDGGLNWTRRRTATTWSISLRGNEILAGCSDGLFRSTNNGNTWNAVALAGSPGSFQRLAVSIAPSDPSVAYAWGASAMGFLWRRAGGTWTAIGLPPGADVGQAWYDWHVAAAPDRPTRSTAGRSTFTAARSRQGPGRGSTCRARQAAATRSIPTSTRLRSSRPPGTVYAGNDGGVFRSDDRGINWIHCNNGLRSASSSTSPTTSASRAG